MRIQPSHYGLELNEYDPFFNYRASKYLLENGLDAYLTWTDDKALYPYGRDVSDSSQTVLHLVAVALYKVFGFGVDFKIFVILLPVVFGSFASIVVFFLVRTLFDIRIASFASLFFSISYPIISRGTIGWFKSEPLGLLFGLTALLFFLIGLRKTKGITTYLISFFGGVVLSLGVSAWGGVFVFVVICFLFISLLPLVRKVDKHSSLCVLTFTSGFFITAMFFTREWNIVSGNAFFFALPIAVFFILGSLKNKRQTKNTLLLMVSVLVIILLVQQLTVQPNDVAGNILSLSGRYMKIVNPFFETSSVYSTVSEHRPTSLELIMEHNSFLIFFAVIGTLLTIKARGNRETRLFVLLFSVIALFVGLRMIRLELFISIALIILSGVGVVWLFDMFVKNKPKRKKIINIIILTSLVLIMVLNSAYSWAVMSSTAPTIMRGGGMTTASSNDWYDAMDWLQKNTPEDSKIFAWWDYGYWITSLTDRTTFMDNSTIRDEVIIMMADAFLSSYDVGLSKIKSMEADYILIQVVAEKTAGTYKMAGGDVSKVGGIGRIAGVTMTKNGAPVDSFWSDTLLGGIIPFKSQGDGKYVFVQKSTPGLELVYVSPSAITQNEHLFGIFIYKIS